jgi:Tol biopolymer transport system component
VLTVSKNGRTGIHLANPDGSRLKLLTANGDSPAWSPDGRWIAFIRTGDVWIIRPDGTGAQRITRTPQEESSPDWLP